jgi:hypothetical protein
MPTTKVAPVAIENPSWMAVTFAGMSGSIWERNCAGTWTRIGPTTVLLPPVDARRLVASVVVGGAGEII